MSLLDRWINRPARYGERGESEGGFERIRKAVDRAFDRVRRTAERDQWSAISTHHYKFPCIDMGETDQAVCVRIDLPGVQPGDVHVGIAGNELLISGVRREEWREETVRHRERYLGSFSRTLRLPAAVDPQSLRTRLESGVMLLNIAKRAPIESWRVPVA